MSQRPLDGRDGRSRRWLLVVLAAAAGWGGCSTTRHAGWFQWRKSSGHWLALALEAENPDDRRKGVLGLANSRDATTEWAVKVFDTIARTDSDAMVRCAAVRALLASAGADRVPTLVKLLDSADRRVSGVRPAPASVRWEAAKVLLAVVERGAYDEAQRKQIVETLLDRLARDEDRNVRLTVIDTAAYFAQRPVPEALIDAMEQDTAFSVKHATERALVALTGTTHHHDPIAWRRWLASVDDPFEGAGRIPPEWMPTERKAWWKRPWQ